MNSPVRLSQSCIGNPVVISGHRPTDSDFQPDSEPEINLSPLSQRSASLSTLQSTVTKPRMAQLATLEAKMASIEVSLSNSPRRRKNGTCGSQTRLATNKEGASKELETLRNALRDKENLIQNLKGHLIPPSGLRLAATRNHTSSNSSIHTVHYRELTENEKKQADERLARLKLEVDTKRLAIKNLKLALERLDITDNIDIRIQQAELEYQLGREELNLLTLHEEMRTIQLLLEECNKTPESDTLYRCANVDGVVTLKAIEVIYDSKNPKFGAGQRHIGPGLWIDWALEETGLCKGDRLIEVNGKIVLAKHRDDLQRLLAAAPDPAQLVILRRTFDPDATIQEEEESSSALDANDDFSLRQELVALRQQAENAHKSKDELKSDNIRLTHRISYLEEQVVELLNRKKPENETPALPSPEANNNDDDSTNLNLSQNVTNITVSSDPAPQSDQLQVFQKGDITAIVGNIPGLQTRLNSVPFRPRSSLSNVSNGSKTDTQHHQKNHNHHHQSACHCHKAHRHRHKSRNSLLGNSVHTVHHESNTDHRNHSHSNTTNNRKHHHHHHHHHHNTNGYSYETDSSILETPAKCKHPSKNNIDNNNINSNAVVSLTDDHINYKSATKIVDDLTNPVGKYPYSYEKHRLKCLKASDKYSGDLLKHYNSRKAASILDVRSGEYHFGGNKTVADNLHHTTTTNGGNSSNLKKLFYQNMMISNNSHVNGGGDGGDDDGGGLDFSMNHNQNTNNGNGNIKHQKISSIHGSEYSLLQFSAEKASRRDAPRDSCQSGYCSESVEVNRQRPMPPKKPLRLSLHKTHSLQSVEVIPHANKIDSHRILTKTLNYRDDSNSNNFDPMIGFWNKRNENAREATSWC